MITLNFKKLWEVMNTLSKKQDILAEENVYIYLLGYNSTYYGSSFGNFLEYYSFKINIKDNQIIVYNNYAIPYEDFSNNDYSYVPICLLSFSAEQIEEWMEAEIQRQLKQQEKDRLCKKENLKLEIERLTNELNNL
jgi:hypothetical protein